MVNAKRAQAVVETLMMLGLVLAAILPVAFYFLGASKQNSDQVAEQQLERITRQISAACDKVYYLGSPSRMVLEFYFPANILASQVNANEIYFQLRKQSGPSDVYASTKAPLTGTLPTTAGYHTVTVESRGDTVWVS